MDNTTATLEGEKLLQNQVEFVASTTVAGILYGVSFTLFCLYAHFLVAQLRDDERKRQARFMLSYSAIVMLCGLYNLVGNAWSVQDAYIKHGSYPGGPYLYVATTLHTPVVIIGLVSQMAVDVLTSAIQIWRVWVVWSATRYATLVIVLPSLCFLTFTALHLRTLILETTLSTKIYLQLDIKTNTAGIAIQGVTTILCTLLISLFLVFEQWRLRKLLGKARGSFGYMKIAAMLIESYAVESLWLLILAILLAPVVCFFEETRTYIEILSYLLVQFRVASGKAYESQRGQGRMSSLRWNHSGHATTRFGEISEADGDLYVASVKPGASVSCVN